MNIIEIPQEPPVEVPTYCNRIVWWSSTDFTGPSNIDILYRSACWLYANAGPLSWHRRLWPINGRQSLYEFVPDLDNDGLGSYDEISLTAKVDFDLTWEAKVDSIRRSLPDHKGDIDYIGYDSGPGWTRIHMYWSPYDRELPRKYCLLIDFEDASLAIQCKLACS
jgi:hypothetical protein